MKRFVSLVVSSVLVAGLLTGCGSNAELQQLNEMQALNSEATVKENYSLSYTNECRTGRCSTCQVCRSVRRMSCSRL